MLGFQTLLVATMMLEVGYTVVKVVLLLSLAQRTLVEDFMIVGLNEAKYILMLLIVIVFTVPQLQ